MVHYLLRYIVSMCIMIALGVANWSVAIFVAPSSIWSYAILSTSAIISFLYVWYLYRKAKLIAEIIDSEWVSYLSKTLALFNLLHQLCKEDTNAAPQQPVEIIIEEECAEDYARPI